MSEEKEKTFPSVIFFGATGNGKSSLFNAFCGDETGQYQAVSASTQSLTTKARAKEFGWIYKDTDVGVEVNYDLTLVDTIGFGDTVRDHSTIIADAVKAVAQSLKYGIYAFIYVFNSRFDTNAFAHLDLYAKLFGEKFYERLILCRTGADISDYQCEDAEDFDAFEKFLVDSAYEAAGDSSKKETSKKTLVGLLNSEVPLVSVGMPSIKAIEKFKSKRKEKLKEKALKLYHISRTRILRIIYLKWKQESFYPASKLFKKAKRFSSDLVTLREEHAKLSLEKDKEEKLKVIEIMESKFTGFLTDEVCDINNRWVKSWESFLESIGIPILKQVQWDVKLRALFPGRENQSRESHINTTSTTTTTVTNRPISK